LKVRPALLSDRARLAALATELGYPTTPSQIDARFASLRASDEDAVLVAEGEETGVHGWMHVHLKRTLQAEACVEIVALVVGAEARGTGVGRALVQAAGAWAVERGIARVRVRSASHRDGAHAFYERCGFRRVKRSIVFEREVEKVSARPAP
jgi:GNAT superfamily N-acetyltransferase